MRTLQWTIVTWLVYIESALILLLLLPWISASLWKKLLQSRVLQAMGRHFGRYKWAFVFVYVVLFVDAARESRTNYYADSINMLNTEDRVEVDFARQLKLFHGQRNLTVTGAAMLLALVLWRFVQLTLVEAGYHEGIDNDMANEKSDLNIVHKTSGGESVKELQRVKEEMLQELERVKEECDMIRQKKQTFEKEIKHLKQKVESSNR